MLRSIVPEVAVAELAGLPRLAIDEGDGADGLAAELQIQRIIGTGGMGRIELGRQRVFGRDVALKRVRPDRYCTEAVMSLLRESRFTGSLEHPNIVPVHQLGLDAAGRPVLVMKRVEGSSWGALFRALPLERNLEILRQVCNAVEFAHRRGVLHRDLKLENVMVGELGEVYVVDWGVAHELSAPLPHDFAGTPAYMAPEMLEPTAPLDARTDVFLLGAMLHELLTGRIRHEGADVQEVVQRARVSLAAVYGADVPEELGALCNRACARDPAERPASALAFGEAVGEFLKHRGSVELAERVERRRLELAAAAEPARVRTLLTETAFGFRQALEIWPQNPLARRGLQLAGERAVQFELEQKNAAGAEAALSALPEPRPDLLEKVRALRAELEEQARAQRELSSMRAAADTRVGAWTRGVIGAVLMYGLGVISLVLSRQGVQLTHAIVIRAFAVCLVLHMVLLALTRKRSLANREGRQRGIAVAVLWAGSLVLALLGDAWRAPIQFTVAAGYLLVSVSFIAVALWTSKWLFVSAGAAAIGAAAFGSGGDLGVDAAISFAAMGTASLVAAWRLKRTHG